MVLPDQVISHLRVMFKAGVAERVPGRIAVGLSEIRSTAIEACSTSHKKSAYPDLGVVCGAEEQPYYSVLLARHDVHLPCGSPQDLSSNATLSSEPRNC